MMSIWNLLLPVFIPIIGGTILLFTWQKFRDRKTLLTYYLSFLSIHGALVLYLGIRGLVSGVCETYPLWNMVEDIPIAFHTDTISMIFVLLMGITWFLIGIYAVEYMGHEEREGLFFGWYLLAGGVMSAVALSANLVTLYLFYEVMTLTTMPMVMHSRERKALYAGLKYLYYSCGGAFAGLFGIVYLYNHGISINFDGSGFAQAIQVAQTSGSYRVVIFCMLMGFGVKAGMFPFHGWLPTAHPVAPAPASAVLSGVITKAGVLAILRMVYFIIGPETIRGTWVQYAWLALACCTVLIGSMMAYREPIMKKRFAYSTVSQLSYILIGLAVLNVTGFVGAVSHVVYHSLIKNILFAVAGAIIVHTGKTEIDKLTGIGKEMPITIWCFTFAALGLVGIPPLAGFVSKWYLANGALEASIGAFRYIAPVVLLISALLTAGYLLPITINGFLPGKNYDYSKLESHEAGLWMLIPLIILSVLVIILGVMPGGFLRLLTTVGQLVCQG